MNKMDAIREKIVRLRITPWVAGGIIGFLAASLQTLASMTHPPAYGFCMACHARDLFNGIINLLMGRNVLGMAPVVADPSFIPVLTIIGVLLGAFVASVISKEFKVRKSESKRSIVKMFILGILVMNFALILSACPIRVSLRTAHGDIIALVGLICIGIGAIIGTMVLQKTVKV